MFSKNLRIYVFIALAIFVLSSSAYAKDYVLVKDKDNVKKEYPSVNILDFTQTHIVFESEGNKIKEKWSDVLSWSVDSDYEKTAAFTLGSKKVKEGNFRSAMGDFEKVLEDKAATEIEKHLSYHYIILSGYLGNDRRNNGFDIVALYAPKFKKDFPNSYFLKDAFDRWGLSRLKLRKSDEAKKIFEELKKYSPGLSYMRLAIMVYYNSEFEKAVPIFLKAVSSPEVDKYTKDFSSVMLANCYQRLKKWTEAKEILEKLTGDTEESSNVEDVLGKAFLYLGTEYGRTGDYSKAFIALMKAYSVYKSNLQKNEVLDAYSFALICANELAKQDEKWKKRAKVLDSEFKNIFSESEYEKRKTEFPK
ncbi:MAG: tetratricopeptide repeat protein [Planctomycetes bacterium]|nr:tetratricopeptide repeat protein [Planctomycetota bacterium]